MDFDLWIETEHVEEHIDDFCNVLVTLQTGETYALNVWTFAFFEVARPHGEETASHDVASPGATCCRLTYSLPICPGRRSTPSSKTCSSTARCQPTAWSSRTLESRAPKIP